MMRWLSFAAPALIAANLFTPPPESERAIDADGLLERIKVLASDEFQGRSPGSPGEEKTIAYVTESFRSLGLSPGNPDGSFTQKVPLVGITAVSRSLRFERGASGRTLDPGKDYVSFTKRVVDAATADGEVVFVGYGAVAPEYQWDDFKDIDVQGKVILMLINDPPGQDIFGGRAMTYYGRWTYKFETAAARGAAGALIVHETGPAGYPWEVVQGSWMGEQFDLVAPDKNLGRAAIEGWIPLDQARALAAMAGRDFEELKRAAGQRDFRPVPLGIRVKADVTNKLRTIDSANVAARIQGAAAPDEIVIYCAHWDHFGMDPSRPGDNVFNGAKDNASGTAALLELAEAFRKLPAPPRRSVLFLAVTAEEQGLLGSRYYAANPLYPLERTVGALNIDGINVLGKTGDVTVVGMGQSTLDDLAGQVASKQGRSLRPDPEPEKGFYYRSDHFPFARVGVPAFDPDEGVEFIGKPEKWGLEMRQRYTDEDYHKPSDEVKPYWDLSGAVDDLRLLYGMGYHLAMSSDWPEWKPTSEFRAIREEQKRKR